MQAERIQTLPQGMAPFCVSRVQAAALVGLSPNMFDAQVAAGKLPKPIQFGRRVVWSVAKLQSAIDALAESKEPSSSKQRGGWSDVGKNALRDRKTKR